MEKADIKLYQILGLDAIAQDLLTLSDKEISSAYRKASLKWHPDKNPNDPKAAEQFALVCEAYETLSTPSKRKQYDDKIRHVRRRQQAFQQMDQTRRKMRHHLQQRERDAGHQHQSNFSQQKNQQSHQNAMKDPTAAAAAARMQKEMIKLQNKHQQERQQQQQQQKQHSSGAQPSSSDRESDVKKRPSQTNHWANVPGFTAFRSQSSKLSFDDFEDAVLEGRNPFGE